MLLNGRQEPLFTVLGELVVCEEWNVVLEGGVGRLEHVSECWWEEWPVSFLGVSSIPWAWSFSRARARSSEVALRARRAEPSATAGAWAWSWSVRRVSNGEWNARACVVLLGMVVPAFVCKASAIASKSNRLSRISCKRWVVKTDSATLLVGMSPQNLP